VKYAAWPTTFLACSRIRSRLSAVSECTMIAFAPMLTRFPIWVFCRLALAAASRGPNSLMWG